MRGAIISLLFLLVAPDVTSGGPVWNSEVVNVFDYTSAAWDGIIEESVADVNAIMPERAPTFVYQRMSAGTRSTTSKHLRAIAVYDSDTDMACKGDDPSRSAMTCKHVARHKTVAVDMRLSNWYARGERPHMENLACHELMHAATDMLDNYGAFPDQSCVWGWLPDPGPLDAEYAGNAYKKRRHR